jgi:hypothetical protein
MDVPCHALESVQGKAALLPPHSKNSECWFWNEGKSQGGLVTSSPTILFLTRLPQINVWVNVGLAPLEPLGIPIKGGGPN